MKQGWIKSIRQSKGLIFVAVTDGAKDFQVTIVEAECKITGELKVGASFEAQGRDSKTPKGLFEFLASDFKIVGSADDSYPIQPKAHGMDFLRSLLEYRGKTKQFQSIWKIRHHLTQAIHKYFDSEGFYLYQIPIIIDSDCEGAGETFQVKTEWLDRVLTVSGQLHGEVGAMSLGKIYSFSPSFRAEKSATKKHLSEFWHLEPEIGWYKMEDAMLLAEKSIKFFISYVLEKCEYEFKQLGITTEHLTSVVDKEWKTIKYEEIIKLFGVKYGEDINSETEQKIVKHYDSPIFITHYPKDLKPFYMKKDDQTAFCFDLIFPEIGELVGGSEREDSYDKLKQSMLDYSLDVDKMEWYLNTRKHGSIPHSGYGMGFERLLMFITKVPKIHDVIPFPVSY